jgi:hypothetical protein
MNEEQARRALGLLHDWGVVHRLQDQIVLTPQRLADVLACVISFKRPAVLDKVLGLPTDSHEMWGEFPRDLHQGFLSCCMTASSHCRFSARRDTPTRLSDPKHGKLPPEEFSKLESGRSGDIKLPRGALSARVHISSSVTWGCSSGR